MDSFIMSVIMHFFISALALVIQVVNTCQVII